MGLRINRGGGGIIEPRARQARTPARIQPQTSGTGGVPALRNPTAGLAVLLAAVQGVEGLASDELQRRMRAAAQEGARVGLDLANVARQTGVTPELPTTGTAFGDAANRAFVSASENMLKDDIALASAQAGAQFSAAMDAGVPIDEAVRGLEESKRAAEQLLNRVPEPQREQFESVIDLRFLLQEESARQQVVRRTSADAAAMQARHMQITLRSFEAVSDVAASLEDGQAAGLAAIAELEQTTQATQDLPTITVAQHAALSAELQANSSAVRMRVVIDQYQRRLAAITPPQPGETPQQTEARVLDEGANEIATLLGEQTILQAGEEEDGVQDHLLSTLKQEAQLVGLKLREEATQAAILQERQAFAVLSGNDTAKIKAGIGVLFSEAKARARIAQIDRDRLSTGAVLSMVAAIEESNGAIPFEQSVVNTAYGYVAAQGEPERTNNMLVGLIHGGRFPDLEKRSLNSALMSANVDRRVEGLHRTAALMREGQITVRGALSPTAETAYDMMQDIMRDERVPAAEAAAMTMTVGQMEPNRRAAITESTGPINSTQYTQLPMMVRAEHFIADEFSIARVRAQPGMRTDWFDAVRREALLLPEGVELSEESEQQIFGRAWNKFKRLYGEHWDGRVLRDPPELRYPNIPSSFQEEELIQSLRDMVLPEGKEFLFSPQEPIAASILPLSRLRARAPSLEQVAPPPPSEAQRELQRAADADRAMFVSLGVDIDDVIRDERVRVVVDDAVRRMDQPTYPIEVQDEVGRWVLVPDMRWRPNGEAFYRVQDEAHADEMVRNAARRETFDVVIGGLGAQVRENILAGRPVVGAR